MHRQELKAILGQLGISQANLARLVDVTPRAVSLWMAGARSIPGPVSAYIQLLASLPLGMRQAEFARLTTEIKTMKDGMYLIEFVGQAGIGYGTLVFDGGRIYGADVAGAKYDGEYQFNESTSLVDVTVRVQIPADQPSVIGIVQPFEWILDVSTEINPEKDCAQMTVKTNVGKPLLANYRFLRPLPMAA